MLAKGNMEKQLYTELYVAERRLRFLHMIYNETKDMQVLRKVQMAKKEVERITERIIKTQEITS